MSHKLKILLDIKNPVFDLVMQKFERATGNSSVDVCLLADITHKAHTIMRELKLDPSDTTAKELYLTLVNAVKNNKIEILLAETDYVLILIDNQIISFNLIDIIESYHHELAFEDRSIKYGQRSLKGELVDRYIKHNRTHDESIYELAKSADLLEP